MELLLKPTSTVLILVLVEDGLGDGDTFKVTTAVAAVLILVLVEDGLGDDKQKTIYSIGQSLNPCFSGGWSRS